MRAALIIVGSELRASEQADALAGYLKKVAGLRHVSVCPGWNRDVPSLKCAVGYHASKAARQPFLLAYIGHGYRDDCRGEHGWSYGYESGDRQLRLSYPTLSDWLGLYREGPTLVLNDCCYADALAVEFVKAGRTDAVGLISASVAEGYSYGDLTPSIIDAWKGGKAYEPQAHPGTLHRHVVQETRSGPELDRHFFPPKPR